MVRYVNEFGFLNRFGGLKIPYNISGPASAGTNDKEDKQ
jgi:hypothetical protein